MTLPQKQGNENNSEPGTKQQGKQGNPWQVNEPKGNNIYAYSGSTLTLHWQGPLNANSILLGLYIKRNN